MFLLNGSPLALDVPFVHEDVQYPANWLRLASAEEKAAIGVTEVADPVRPDDRFYWASQDGTSVPKDLAALKTEWEKRVNDAAYSLLAPTDWTVVRKMETGVDAPAGVNAYRTAVRTAANAHRAALAGAADFDAFVALATSLDWPKSPDAVV